MEPVLTPDQEAKVKALVLAGYSMDSALIAVLLVHMTEVLDGRLSDIAACVNAIPSGPAI